MSAFLKLIRLPNLLIIVVLQYFIRYFIIYPVLKIHGFDLQLSPFDFFLLVFSTLLLAAAGYIINDYFDQKIDIVNRPDKVIVGKKINRRLAMLLHLTFNGIAVIIGFYLAWVVDIFIFAFINLVAAGIFWYYSTTYKKMFLVGNLVVAVTSALPALGVVIFDMLKLYQNNGPEIVEQGLSFSMLFAIVGSFSFFSFLTNFIRELIKDLEDLEGDSVYGRRTLPIVLNVKPTKFIITCFILITIFLLGYVYLQFLTDPITLWYFLLFLIIPLVLLMLLVIRSSTQTEYHKAGLLLKIIMLAGVFYAPVIFYIVTYKIAP